jgi:prevent-host-death family protein
MVERPIEDVLAHLDEVVPEVDERGERVVITVDGKPVAALINRMDFRAFEELDANGGVLRETEEYIDEVVAKGYITRQAILDAGRPPA